MGLMGFLMNGNNYEITSPGAKISIFQNKKLQDK